MSQKDQKHNIGDKVIVHMYSLRVIVIIEDIKTAYGRPLYLVTPVQGDGGQWLEKVYEVL